MDTSSKVRKSLKLASLKANIGRIITERWFAYLFMVAILVYILLSGYVLYFSGDLFIEAVVKGWYRASASEFDFTSFFLGFWYGFASLCGVIGGLTVLSTRQQSFLKYYGYYIKVLLFIPSVVCTTFLTIHNLYWGFQYWTQWLFLVPIMLLCIFVLFCVVKRVTIPYFANARPTRLSPGNP